MKKKILFLSVFLFLILGFTGCKQKSTFSIEFIDVGQGDAALIECDGEYMLIDGGGDKQVRQALEDRGIQHLNILAISHMHEDHISGLPDALRYTTQIDLTISNTDHIESNPFSELNSALRTNGAKITIPNEGDKYDLGSAVVEVVRNQKSISTVNNNECLVLLVTYKKTKFLFTGDIESKEIRNLTEKYDGYNGKEYKVDLIKMPHHGAYYSELNVFLRTFMPDYAIISDGNEYGHPSQQTLDLFGSHGLDAKVYRTDKNGNITVKSDGKNVKIETQK